LLRISEKRYKAELEVESLKQVLAKKNAYIHEIEIKMKEMKKENEFLKTQVVELEEENKDLT
jgi:predicted RNA-binding protein with PUA domain